MFVGGLYVVIGLVGKRMDPSSDCSTIFSDRERIPSFRVNGARSRSGNGDGTKLVPTMFGSTCLCPKPKTDEPPEFVLVLPPGFKLDCEAVRIPPEVKLGDGLIPNPEGVDDPLLPMATLCCSPLFDFVPPN
jgi:hypothetical protein